MTTIFIVVCIATMSSPETHLYKQIEYLHGVSLKAKSIHEEKEEFLARLKKEAADDAAFDARMAALEARKRAENEANAKKKAEAEMEKARQQDKDKKRYKI